MFINIEFILIFFNVIEISKMLFIFYFLWLFDCLGLSIKIISIDNIEM